MDRYISNISKAKIDVDECAQLIDMARRFNPSSPMPLN